MTPKKKEPAAVAPGSPGARQAEDQKPAAPKNAASGGGQAGYSSKRFGYVIFAAFFSVDVELDLLTVLIGQNNSGKNQFSKCPLRCYWRWPEDKFRTTIFFSARVKCRREERVVVIDILIRPTDDQGKIINVFPRGARGLNSGEMALFRTKTSATWPQSAHSSSGMRSKASTSWSGGF